MTAGANAAVRPRLIDPAAPVDRWWVLARP